MGICELIEYGDGDGDGDGDGSGDGDGDGDGKGVCYLEDPANERNTEFRTRANLLRSMGRPFTAKNWRSLLLRPIHTKVTAMRKGWRW